MKYISTDIQPNNQESVVKSLVEGDHSTSDLYFPIKDFKPDFEEDLALCNGASGIINGNQIVDSFNILNTINEGSNEGIFRLPKQDLLNDCFMDNQRVDDNLLIQEEFYDKNVPESAPMFEFKYLEGIVDKQTFSDICEADQKYEDPAPTSLTTPKNVPKGKRWGKKQDIELFNEFRKFELKGLICLEELKKLDMDAWDSPHDIINTIRSTLGTDKSCEFLINRLICHTNDNFSVRETKLLKRLIRKNNYKDLDYPKLLENFRGKTLDGLKAACNHLYQERSLKRLHKITNMDK
ncbi:unnamed protein product [Moneuplotes crassus]|uniref:Uncharacterized protein n=1 Tax=Euplotes crassus TaxID=5936 RepID=A0AAD1XAA0_EUPCR|nr:unnamed protein product [Moneuplotes crassus]